MKEEQRSALIDFVTKPFTPGALCRKFGEVFGDTWDETLFIRVIDFAEEMVNGSFGEGYWSDHWTYNLDLILDYLSVFPEQEKDCLLYTSCRVCQDSAGCAVLSAAVRCEESRFYQKAVADKGACGGR